MTAASRAGLFGCLETERAVATDPRRCFVRLSGLKLRCARKGILRFLGSGVCLTRHGARDHHGRLDEEDVFSMWNIHISEATNSDIGLR